MQIDLGVELANVGSIFLLGIILVLIVMQIFNRVKRGNMNIRGETSNPLFDNVLKKVNFHQNYQERLKIIHK